MTQNNTIDKVEVKRIYYPSGALWYETPYVDGKEHGIEKGYYESGALKKEIPYENGEMHGIVKAYYESGDLWYEAPYVNGKKHGISRDYDNDNSNIYCLTLYDKDREAVSIKSNI